MSTAATGSIAAPRLRRVPVDRPWTWLALGWRDLLASWRVGLCYGIGIVVASYAVLYMLQDLQLIHILLPLTGAFFLVAPILAVGLYETSRRLQTGESVTPASLLSHWRSPRQLAFFGVVLLIIHLAWVRIAMLLFALFVGEAPPDLSRLVQLTFFTQGSLTFLVIGTVIGGAFAAVTFAISAVSLPMLIDRECDVITAAATSVRTVLYNWQAMALWAALIVVLTGAGIVTGFIGLAVVLPLVGHATWHAYRDLLV
jgi:uncharacterized membrane protein